jgi:hypothetical protein
MSAGPHFCFFCRLHVLWRALLPLENLRSISPFPPSLVVSLHADWPSLGPTLVPPLRFAFTGLDSPSNCPLRATTLLRSIATEEVNSESLSNYVSRGSLVSFPYQCLCTPVPSAVVSTGACYFRPCSSVSFPAPTTYRPHFLLSTVVFQMPREPRPCSQERRAWEAERQRVRRRSLTDATDPVIVACRNNERDRRILQRRYAANVYDQRTSLNFPLRSSPSINGVR